MVSEVKANKISPASGTAITLGDSGDTFTLPSGATIVNSGTATGFGGGKVLQVVQTEITATVTMTSNTMIDLTGMTVDITPAATSSKILVSVTGSGSVSHGDNAQFKIQRDGSDIHVGDAASSRTRAFFGWSELPSNTAMTVNALYLDSPSTTSAVTYKVQWKGYAVSRVNAWNRTSTDADTASYYRGASSIIVMEIGA